MPRKAIEYHEQHLAIAREIGDRRGEGNALGNLGIAWTDLGEAAQGDRATTSSTSRSRARSATGAARATRWAIWASPGRISARPRKAIELLRAGPRDRARDRRPARRGQRAGQSGHRLGRSRRAAQGDRALRAGPRDRARDRRPARCQYARLWNLALAHDALGEAPEAIRCACESLVLHAADRRPVHAEGGGVAPRDGVSIRTRSGPGISHRPIAGDWTSHGDRGRVDPRHLHFDRHAREIAQRAHPGRCRSRGSPVAGHGRRPRGSGFCRRRCRWSGRTRPSRRRAGRPGPRRGWRPPPGCRTGRRPVPDRRGSR